LRIELSSGHETMPADEAAQWRASLTSPGKALVYETTIETSVALFAPLAATTPPWTTTCTFPLKGLARVIVTLWAWSSYLMVLIARASGRDRGRRRWR
jgi:hypothetical protein